VKSTFAGIVAEMAQEWVTNFIKKLVSSSAEGAASIVSNLASAVGGDGATSVAGGISSLAGNVASLASPVTAISTAVSAIASVISLFKKPGGPSTTDSWHFQETWKNTKEIRDWHFINHQARLDEIAKYIDAGNPKLDRIGKYLHDVQKPRLKDIKNATEGTEKAVKGSQSHLKAIQSNTRDMAKYLRNIKTGQKGLRIPAGEVQMAILHGPEWVLPEADLKSLMKGFGGGRGRNVTIDVKNRVDISGQMITTREFTRSELLPEILNALKGAFSKTELKEALGIS